MKLKDEQGNEWEFDVQIGNYDRKYGILLRKDPNPMPDLEVGDWYAYESLEWGGLNVYDFRGGELRCPDKIVEIRKKDGTAWRRGA